jgi:Zn finger protein HypA/HybF involved in hydrogenase expression
MNIERKELILRLRKEGYTIPQICEELKISKGTVGYYLKDFPQKRKKNVFYVKKEIDKFKILDKIGITKEEFIIKSNNSLSINDLSTEFAISKNTIKKLQVLLNCVNLHPNYTNGGRGRIRDFSNILNGIEIVENTQGKSITGMLKKFILKNNLKEHKCEECGLNEWNNKPLSLELDHTDGIRSNNKIENLKLLCPNCHSQTPTWRGRNKVKK